MQTIFFGGDSVERLEIALQGYERSTTGDYWDDNWLVAKVSISVGGFRGKFQASLQAGEVQAFHDGLVALLETLEGRVEFETLEEQLSLALIGDGLGHIRVEGQAMDQAGIGNRLSFNIDMDQTQLQLSVQSLREAIAAFPVRK